MISRLSRPNLPLRMVLAAALLAPLWTASEVLAAESGPEPSAAESPLLEMRSGFWLNLHMVLYREARQARAPELAREEGESESLLPQAASEGEREAWGRSVDHYRRRMVDRDLLFDQGMVELGNRLGALGDGALPGDLPFMLSTILADAAPAYRNHLWEADDAANQAWSVEVAPALADHGAPLAEELSRALAAPWPEGPMVVDLAAWANWSGAYTTLEPTRVTVATQDERNQGEAALEVLFHEAGHALIGELRLAIERERQEQGVSLAGRGRLWHAVLFATVGDLVARRFEDYEPYAERQGLWSGGAWPEFQRVIDAHWRPYLDGRLPYETAIERMVADLARAASP